MVPQPHEDQLPRGAGHQLFAKQSANNQAWIHIGNHKKCNPTEDVLKKKTQHMTQSWTARDISERRGKHKELNCSVHVKMLSAGLTTLSHIYYTHRRAGERQILLQPIHIRPSAQEPVRNHLTTNKLLFQICHFTFRWRALMYSNIWGFRLGVGLLKKKNQTTKTCVWKQVLSSPLVA